MTSHEKILDRVRKLLRLAERSSEHEAALAAAHAAELIKEHALTEAMLRLDVEDESTKPAEPIVEGFMVDPNARRKRIAWKGTIASAVADAFGAHMYWMGGKIVYFGRTSAVQAAAYTTQYLWNEVEAFCGKEWKAERSQREDDQEGHGYASGFVRKWKNSFRLGCAQRLSVRLRDQQDARRLAASAVFYKETSSKEMSTKRQKALVLLDKDREELDAEYDRFSQRVGMRATRAIGRVSVHSGYARGRDAGDRISLGGARGELKAPAPRLKGGGG